MSPRKIIRRSLDLGLDLIAVCDHNTAENAGAAMREGQKQGLGVLPGMEICSKEEVHILALFEELEKALLMQDFVYDYLPGENQPDIFGCQVVANEYDEVLGENLRMLIGATQLGLAEIVEKTHSLEGISIFSHVDRTAYGIIGQLGFIPPDVKIDGIEVSYRIALEKARESVPGIDDLPCVTSSDAHFLEDVGKVSTVFLMAEPRLAEIRLALLGIDGRRILV